MAVWTSKSRQIQKRRQIDKSYFMDTVLQSKLGRCVLIFFAMESALFVSQKKKVG